MIGFESNKTVTELLAPLFERVPDNKRHLLDVSVVYSWPPGAWNCRIVLFASDVSSHHAVYSDAVSTVLETAVREAVRWALTQMDENAARRPRSGRRANNDNEE